MRSKHRARSRLGRNLFRPQLETLEQRQAPACTLSVVGSTLFIHGDNTANNIDITVQGLGTTVTCEGAAPAHFSGIDHLNIDTGDGDDRLQILIGSVPAILFRVEADLGNGNDQFHLDAVDTAPSPPSDLPPSTLPPSAGTLEVLLGTDGGNDTAEICINHIASARIEMDLGAGNDIATIENFSSPQVLSVRAGEGNDVVGIFISDQGGQLYKIDEDLGAGNDTTQIEYVASDDTSSDSANLQFTLVGGADDDLIELAIDPAADGSVRFLADTGNGDDRVQLTGGGSVDLFADIDLGAGNDTLEDFSSPAVLSVHAGAGSDHVFLSRDDGRLPMVGSDLERQGVIEVDLGEGNDTARVQYADGADTSSDSPNLLVTVLGGAGDDLIELEIDPAADGSVRFLADTGSGNDRLSVTGGSSVDLFADIDLGADNDTAMVDLPPIPTEIPGKVRELNLAAGTGDDIVNVRIGGLVDVSADIDLGAGDDQLALTLNRDSPPVDDTTSIVHVIIDASSGTDGVVCDVQHVTFEEIFASFSILGVGMVSVDALFPTGLLRLREAARDSRAAGPTKVALTQVGPDLAIDMTTGASDDLIELEMDPAADGSVRFLVDTGGGNDSVTATGSRFIDFFANIDLGADNDTALVEYPTDPEDFPTDPGELQLNLAAGTGDDAVTVRGSSFFDVHADIDLGAGNDQFDLTGVSAGVGPSCLELNLIAGTGDDLVNLEASRFFEVSFVIDFGAGNDQTTIEIPRDPLHIPGKVRELHGKILGGDGNDVTHSCIPMSSADVFLDIDLGTGNDRALLEQQGQFPVVPLAETHSLRANVAAGSGDDEVEVLFGMLPPFPTEPPSDTPPPDPTAPNLFDVFFNIDLGAGNDRAMVDIIPDSLELAGKVRELHLTIDAGAGNDVVQDCDPMTLFTDAFLDFDLGAGNDVAMIEQYEGLTDPGQLQFTVVGGTGNDVVNFQTDRFFDVFANIDLGAGNDSADFRYSGGTPDPAGQPRQLHLNMLGGIGDDFLRADVSLFPGSMCVVDLDGGNGRDTIRGRYEETPSTGQPPAPLHFHVLGGQGDDDLALIVATNRPQAYLDLLLDGGPGFDRGFVTPNVTIINCEDQAGGPPSDL